MTSSVLLAGFEADTRKTNENRNPFSGRRNPGLSEVLPAQLLTDYLPDKNLSHGNSTFRVEAVGRLELAS